MEKVYFTELQKKIEGDQEVMRRARFDPKARGIDCAVKRDNVIGAKDQRTTSGPASTGRRHDRTHDQTQYRKITLDQRAPSRHVNARLAYNRESGDPSLAWWTRSN